MSALRSVRATIVALAAGAMVASAPAAAQERPNAGSRSSGSNTERGYDDDLMRLAELLGALHFLRPLCGSGEAMTWREAMNTLLDAEQPDDRRRQALVANFNRGYATFRRSYRMCTPAAMAAAERYRREGVRLTAQVVSRYAR